MRAKSGNVPPQSDDPFKGASEGKTGLSQKRDWLRLIRTPYVGGATFWQLLEHFGSAASAIEALPDFARAGARIAANAIPSLSVIDAEIEKAEAAGLTLVARGEEGYPPLLAQVEAPPPLLYLKGVRSFWDRPPVAIVGARQATGAGLKFAGELSRDLGERGFSIVSGLARGIDAAAHRAALPFATCAILPGGLDAVYPAEHDDLADRIAASGLLLSECPPGFHARAQDFPRRNRIISGASLGVVVVEAAAKSGSLITARLAAEQNREVFAVPGHPYEARAAGTNALIKEGAVCTTSAEDIAAALGSLFERWERPADPPRSPAPAASALDRTRATGDASPAASREPVASGPLDALTEKLLPFLTVAPIDTDDLCRLSGEEPRHISAALLFLELSGRIERRGRFVALKP
jgi:DNA processing protein